MDDGDVTRNPKLDFGMICSFQVATCPIGNHLSWQSERRKNKLSSSKGIYKFGQEKYPLMWRMRLKSF